MKSKLKEPYQPLFLSGLLISFLGVGIWLASNLGWLHFYPQQSHAFLMVTGFLFSYIYGFLMTAVPKMSNTLEAQAWEIYGGVTLVWLQALTCFIFPDLVFLLSIFQFLFILLFVVRRWVKRRAQPPPGFVFVPFGLFMGLVGCVLLSTGNAVTLGKAFIYQAFVLNLILGLGSRLIPALSRAQGALDVRAASAEKMSYFFTLALILNFSFVIEAYASFAVGNILKFSIISWIAIHKFKIFKPRQPGQLGRGIRIAVCFLASGFLLAGAFPAYGIHFFHLSYIGGFALLTILISTRVVLAHGGHDLSFELIDPNIKYLFVIFGALAFSRVALATSLVGRELVLTLLFFGWCLGLAMWCRSYLKKLVFQQIKKSV